MVAAELDEYGDTGFVELANVFKVCIDCYNQGRVPLESAWTLAAQQPANGAPPPPPVHVPVYFAHGPLIVTEKALRRSPALAAQFDMRKPGDWVHCAAVERHIGALLFGDTRPTSLDLKTTIHLLCAAVYLGIDVAWWSNYATNLAQHLFFVLPGDRQGKKDRIIVESARNQSVVRALHRVVKAGVSRARFDARAISGSEEYTRETLADRVDMLMALLRTTWPCVTAEQPIPPDAALQPLRVEDGPRNCVARAQLADRVCEVTVHHPHAVPRVKLFLEPGQRMMHAGAPPYMNYAIDKMVFGGYRALLRERPEVLPVPSAGGGDPMPVIDVFARTDKDVEVWVCSFPVP